MSISTESLKRAGLRADTTRAVDNVDLRLLDRFRIAQRLNRGGRNELHALDEIRERVEEHRRVLQGGTAARLANVIRFPNRD